MNEKSLKEIKNIKVHIEKGCLSGIPPECGTNKNERLNRHLLNDFLSTKKLVICWHTQDALDYFLTLKA